MHFTEYDTRLAAYALIVDDQDRILLSWWNGEGVGTPGWTLPGGGVEFEETLEEGVVREVREETGYDVEVGTLIATHSWQTMKPARDHLRRPFKSMRVVYEARVIGGELGTLEVGGSTDSASWVPLATLDDEPGETSTIVEVAVSAHRRRQAEGARDR